MNEPSILLETEDLLLLNKPAGMVVERDRYEYPSVEVWVWNYLQKTSKRPFVGIVHRLDRPVSGVLLIAKKPSILKLLNEQFREKMVKKTYLAICSRKPPDTKGQLHHWIQKDQKNKIALVFSVAEKNRAACRLSYQLLDQQEGLSLLKVNPETGKFHQIRAQFAAVGCPIAGDLKYGSAVGHIENGICLHALELGFQDPKTNQLVFEKAPVPAAGQWLIFKNTIEKLITL